MLCVHKNRPLFDRSLDFFLYSAAETLFQPDRKRVFELIQALDLIHVHGQLGRSEWLRADALGEYRGYQPTLDAIEMGLAADALSHVHEEPGDTEALAQARVALERAERVAFIGFSFHPLNTRRLGDYDRLKNRELLATSFGMPLTLKRAISSKCLITLHDLNALDFMNDAIDLS